MSIFQLGGLHMTTAEFISKIEIYESKNDSIKLYPTTNEKALHKFWQRLFWLPNVELHKSGWLDNLYKYTNGINLLNYYIVPYNTYFNKKSQSFDEFCREWIVNQDNQNEILADFYAFMTDRKSLIGYLDNLKGSKGHHFIAYSKSSKYLKDLKIIFSSIYELYEHIIECIANKKMLDFSQPLDFFISRDQELRRYYEQGIIKEYKEKFLFQDDSDILKNK